jgi:hypothetical protein
LPSDALAARSKGALNFYDRLSAKLGHTSFMERAGTPENLCRRAGIH